jgi:hypothetical protein
MTTPVEFDWNHFAPATRLPLPEPLTPPAESEPARSEPPAFLDCGRDI